MRFVNTLTRRKETFAPADPKRVTFYSCGPTVYNLIHVGNLRGALVADLVVRALRHQGYGVVYVRNYTDVDDKIITRAAELGLTPLEIANRYITEVERDYAMSGCLEPDHKTRVTDHLGEIIAMIERLIERGMAYVVDGEVLYSIEAFAGYGKLSGKKLEDLLAGHRVAVAQNKRNPLDFTLWKPAKPGEPAWPSPWGEGRPGWHIECSAMASRWLGEQIDLHHGGEDLIFPHHENEIAQSEGASQLAPFARVWLHHAFVTLSQTKMSKSLGNVFTARRFLELYGGEVARYLLLSTHYRSPIDFGDEAIEQALQALTRLYEAKAQAAGLISKRAALPDLRAESAWGEFVAESERVRRLVREELANDLNVAGALGAVFTLIREYNRTLGEPRAQATPSVVLGSQALLDVIEGELGAVVGVGLKRAESMLLELGEIRRSRAEASGEARLAAAEIEALLAERVSARAARDFARADAIRKQLDAGGVVIQDVPARGGEPARTKWEYR